MLDLTRAWITAWRRTPTPSVTPDMVNAIEELANEIVSVREDGVDAVEQVRLSLRAELDNAELLLENSIEALQRTLVIVQGLVNENRTRIDETRQKADETAEVVDRVADPVATPTVFPGTFDQPGGRSR